MKTEFKIPVEWSVFGVVKIEANSIDEALEYFNENIDEISLPEGDYIDNSFKLSDYTKEEILELYN